MFKGELDSATIKGVDLDDLYTLEQGTRKEGAKKILIKHYGVENTGGLTNEELLNMGEVVKNGSVLLESFEKRNNGVRYAYEWDNNGVKLRLVVDDLDSGNKIFDFYSDKNITGAGPTQKTPTKQNTILKEVQIQEDSLKTQEKPQKTTQEPKSPLEQANAEKLAKLESDRIESEKEFLANHQIFLKETKSNAITQININKTESLEAIGQTKTSKLKMKLVERKNRSLSKH
ncbi:DUF3519 domain-containing protein [Helicobacter pylori]|nr:DUF3519 domain-containing protein [Helicobacter pylori]